MHRHVSAQRGLIWLAQAWQLVIRTPRPLIPMVMWLCVGMLLPVVSLLVIMLLCVFYGGIITAIHKRSTVGQTTMMDMFNGFKSAPHFLGLWLLGVPNMLFAFSATFAIMSAIGPEAAEQMASGVRPDQKTMEALMPVILQTLLKLLPLGLLISWFIFIAVPRVILDNRGGLSALWDAAKAIASNFFAMLMFTFAYGVAMGLTAILLAIPISLLAVMGPLGAIAQMLFAVFITTLSLVLYLASMYYAWRDMYADQALVDATASLPSEKTIRPESAQIEV